jgi:hypothetical protein
MATGSFSLCSTVEKIEMTEKVVFYAKKYRTSIFFSIKDDNAAAKLKKVKWEFGDGKDPQVISSNFLVQVPYDYDQEKEYTVILSVWESNNSTKEYNYQVPKKINIISLPHEQNIISLDGDFSVFKGDWIAIDKNRNINIFNITDVSKKSITAYGISGKSTEIDLNQDGWIQGEYQENPDNFDAIRKTTVYCQPEELELAGEPIIDKITNSDIAIDGDFQSFLVGRKIVISGESDEKDKAVGPFSETGKITSASEESEIAIQLGGKTAEIKYAKISLKLDKEDKNTFCLKRDTVKIYGNVVAATQGETRREVLGSGDGRKELQSFVLKTNEKTPLVYVSAATPTGAESTLKVFVNDIQWDEAEILTDRTSTDQNFLTKTDEDGKVRILFGDGKHGARLPTGNENVKAEYRTGLSGAGNVNPGQISLLVDRPLGVKEVINPIAAGSGSDKDKLEQARKNVLRKIKALDRLISVQDYEDFTAAYAGIGKSKAVEISNGKQQVVHVTVAGTTSKSFDSSSELLKKLRKALHDFGDPQQKILLADRELLHIVLKARVRIFPKYQWEPVKMQLQRKLLDAFSFERRELGQDVLLGEMYSIMQAVPGVDYVDVDVFGGVPERIKGDNKRLLTSDEISYAISLLSKQIKLANDEYRLLTFDEIAEAVLCKLNDSQKTVVDCMKYIEETKMVRQRLEVNQAVFENGQIRSAQIAFLSPELLETLILDEIK